MAKLIDHNSIPSTKTELDLFSLPPTQVSIESGYWAPIRLVNNCTSSGPWQFYVQANPQYLQLSKNYLWVKLRILKGDGSRLTPDQPAEGVNPAVTGDKVGPINIIGKTLFKQIKVSLNGRQAFDSGDNYAYRAFLETELNYGDAAKSTQLTAALYSKDRPSDKVDTVENQGLTWRQEWFKGSQVVEVMAPIHCELFQTERLLLDNTEMYLELHRNNDAFALMSHTAGANYKIEVIDMVWFVRKIEILKSVQMGIETTLNHHPAKYPIRRIQVTKLHVSPGRRSVPTNTLFTGQLPRRLVLGFVDMDAYYGNYKKSPFNFKNYSIKKIKLTAGGQVFPREPMEMDFAANQFMKPYINLFEGMGQARDDTGNAITLGDFKNSHCLFVFDLTPDEQDSGHWDLIREGSVSVDIEFGSDVPEPGIEMIVYAEFDNLVTIDRNRNVYFDYNV